MAPWQDRIDNGSSRSKAKHRPGTRRVTSSIRSSFHWVRRPDACQRPGQVSCDDVEGASQVHEGILTGTGSGTDDVGRGGRNRSARCGRRAL
jgi:hypothetical protein